jgi:hypothetical protein
MSGGKGCRLELLRCHWHVSNQCPLSCPLARHLSPTAVVPRVITKEFESVMSTRQRILKAEDIVRHLNQQIVRAIALRAMWARCADHEDILCAMRSEHLAPGFRVIRDSLHIDLILTLMRLHDTPAQEPLSIPVVVEILRDPAVQQSLCNSGAEGATIEALALYEAVPGDLLRRLRQHRDRVLAHNDRRGLDVEPTMGDETTLLRQSAEIVTAMDRAIRRNGGFFAEPEKFWTLLAHGFWSEVARGAVHSKMP